MATQDLIRWDMPLSLSALMGILILNVGQNLAWGGLSLGTLWVTTMFPLHSHPPARHWLAHLLASALIVPAGMVLIAGMAFVHTPPRGPLLEAFLRFAFWFISFEYLICYWGVVGLHEGFQILQQYREKEFQVSLLESQLAESQLQALRVQLNPHFLFNTLNTLSALLRSDPVKADGMLIRLSHFLRVSLEKNREECTSLGQELSLLEDYLDIERVRFGEHLRVVVEVPRGLQEARIPAFILQPLLENAIKHGLTGCRRGGEIHLRAHQADHQLVLEVQDNGLGIHGGGNPVQGTHLGLNITRNRLERHYGPDQSFSLQFPEEGGALARISLPLQMEPEVRSYATPCQAEVPQGLSRFGVIHE
jgi:hypothetical protein